MAKRQGGRKKDFRRPSDGGLVASVVDGRAVRNLIETIENYASQSVNNIAMVTFLDVNGWMQTYDVQYHESGCVWGYDKAHRALLLAKLMNSDRHPISIVVRTFNAQRFKVRLEDNREIEVPGKDIRMYLVKDSENIVKLSPEECFAAYNIDSRTGQPLDLDPTITCR